jgi:hypothetical protein
MAGTPTAPWNFGSRATRHDLRAQVPRQSAGPSKDSTDIKTPLWELEGSIKESLMAARIPNIYHGSLLTRRSVIGTDVSSICMPAYRESDAGAPFAVSDWTSGGRSIARWRLTRDIGVLSPSRTCRVHARLLRRCYSPSHWRRPQRGQMRRRAIS